MMSSGRDVCDEDESDVVPPCPMLWLDEVRNAGEAVEYVTNPRHQWASQTSQLAYNKLNYSGVARDQSCEGGDTTGSICAADSHKFNETGNHVVEDNMAVEDNVTESAYDLITCVDNTAEESCFQSVPLSSKLIVDKLNSEDLIVKQDSEEMIVDEQYSNVLVVDNLDTEELIVKQDSDEWIVDKQDSEELIVDKQDYSVLVVDNLDSKELIVKPDSEELIVDKQDSEELIVDKQDSEELIVDKQDSEELIVDKLDSNEDDRPACVNVESIDDIRSDLSELLHLELSKDTNDGDRETTQNIVGVDHLSQEVAQETAQKPDVQDLSLHLAVSKTDACRKSSTNLHVEMDIAAAAVNVHMLIDEQDKGHLKPDQHLALDMCYTKSLGDLAHHCAIPINSQVGLTDSGKPGRYEEGMLLVESNVLNDHVGSSNVKVKVHVQEPPSEGQGTVGLEKLLTYSGLVNPGFKPEDDDDEAIYMTKQLNNSYPVEVWSQAPAEAYNYDSGLPEIRIDDGYSNQEDTNDDIRDFRCGNDAVDTVEEIDPLVNEEAEGGDRTGCEVDTNQDMRPVCENMAAFDHLSSEVTGQKHSGSNTQVDCGLRVSDINLHFSVSNNSLKIDLALKAPDSAGLSEDKRLENFQTADCSSCVMKTGERLQTDGALKAQSPCRSKTCRDQAILHESITGAAQHLYLDELYLSTDQIEGQGSNNGGVEPTIDTTGESYESLHYALSSFVDKYNNAIEGLDNVSSPVVFENHECTGCQNVMLSSNQDKLPVTFDEVGALNCCTRNKKTITRSTHLDCPATALHPDIYIQKPLFVPSCSELGELSAAICTHDSLSASRNLVAMVDENVAGLSFQSAPTSEWSDMAACAATCFDTVFWVCLVVVIILFEMYKCYWLFLLPSCLFILSVLVSDNPKPSE